MHTADETLKRIPNTIPHREVPRAPPSLPCGVVRLSVYTVISGSPSWRARLVPLVGLDGCLGMLAFAQRCGPLILSLEVARVKAPVD